MANLYKDDDIQSLSPLEFTRLRPGVYAGSTEYSTQLLIEIVSNAIDEFKVGNGSVINVEYTDDGKCRVEDFGQGFPVNVKREDGETVLQASFDVLNTSGKFSEDGVYEGTALGLNGIGSKLTNFLSHWLTVQTVRDGKYELIKFKEGVFDSRQTGSSQAHTGTVVEWQASEEFFTNVQIEENRIKKLFHVLTCLCPGLTINLTHNGDTTKYFSKNGLNDLVDDIVGDTEIIKRRLNIEFEEGKNKLDLVLTYTANYSSNIISYVNTGETDAGPHITQIKTLITREFNKFFKEKGILKEKDANLTGDDIQEGILVAFNITAPGVSYDAQTKSRIVKLDMSPFTSAIVDALQEWMNRNEKEVKSIAEKALLARKAREKAKAAREAVRGKAEKKKKALKFDSKLADANAKNRLDCELYVTEGDSASGNLKMARNESTQAVIPVRGKVLNCEKATMNQILKNAEIMTMLDAFFGHDGWSLNAAGTGITYDMKKLRYGKIIIASDADVDGAHIKNLFYTFIWKICPELINQGHIYALVAPLYRIIEGNGKSSTYLKDDSALLQYRETHKGKKYEVKRMKGLGEMDEDETKECLTDPETRNIREVHIEDAAVAARLFTQLMGDSVVYRKQFLKDYGNEAMYNAE